MKRSTGNADEYGPAIQPTDDQDGFEIFADSTVEPIRFCPWCGAKVAP